LRAQRHITSKLLDVLRHDALALHDNPVKRVIVATYQSVSGTGREAIKELTEQTSKLLENQRVAPHVYPHEIAHNLLPEIGSFKDDGYTSEEWKMAVETRKIMHEPELLLSATCVRVPVYVSHSAAVHVELSRQMDPDDFGDLMREAPGVVVQDDPSISLYPQPRAAAGRDEVFVGRIRQDSSHPGLVTGSSRQPAQRRRAERAPDRRALVCRGLIWSHIWVFGKLEVRTTLTPLSSLQGRGEGAQRALNRQQPVCRRLI
jgi:hypothetical protein